VLLARQVNVPNLVVALKKVRRGRTTRKLLGTWWRWKVRELVTSYGFPGTTRRGGVKRAGAINGEAAGVGVVLKDGSAGDSYIPIPEREIEKTFMMPIEDVFSSRGEERWVTGRISTRQGEGREEIEIAGFRRRKRRS